MGTRHVTLNSFLSPAVSSQLNPNGSLNELILHVNAAGQSSVTLSFDQKEFNDEDNPIPQTFTGSVNGDGVALSVDGTNWFRLFDLTGFNSTNTYQTKTINLSEFAANQGLTLGADVRIKLQQFGASAIPNDGFAFDNISVTSGSEILGTCNDDTLIGTAGSDTIKGFNAQDILNGLVGNDTLDGGDGDDKLYGGEGNDTLLGGQGQDLLNGSAGDNTLSGGAGQDIFVLSTQGKNTIVDFEDGLDLLLLTDGLSFGSLSIFEENGGTRIATNDNQPLAFLTNVNPNLITVDDFVTHCG